MGSGAVQSTIWGPRAADWADVQERTVVPLYASVIEALNVRAPMAVLDVGCGSGLFCQLAAEHGASVSGIDATSMLLDIARRRVPRADFRHCDMEQLPFPNRTFHIVTGFHAFEHADVPLNALCEAHRVARPGGAVVAAVWGRPDQVQAAEYLDAIAALLPVPRSGLQAGGAAASFALSEADALPDLARDAGLEPIRSTEVDCVWRYADERTALRGLLSAGPAVRAIQASGERAVRQAVLKAIAPYRLPTGGYELLNTCRYVIAKA